MSLFPVSKPCPCGSGEYRRDLTDAAGIFCGFVCDACEAEKRARFNPAIFAAGSPYATSGEEEDIGLGPYGDDGDDEEPFDEPERHEDTPSLDPPWWEDR